MSKLNDVTPEQWDVAAKRGALSAQERGILRATKRTKEMDTLVMHEEYSRQQRLNMGIKERSDGSSASYYELPGNASELQDLISDKNMNAQIGEIFRECYRYGRASHSDEMRGIKKILFYAKAELVRLQNLEKQK